MLVYRLWLLWSLILCLGFVCLPVQFLGSGSLNTFFIANIAEKQDSLSPADLLIWNIKTLPCLSDVFPPLFMTSSLRKCMKKKIAMSQLIQHSAWHSSHVHITFLEADVTLQKLILREIVNHHPSVVITGFFKPSGIWWECKKKAVRPDFNFLFEVG